jgi:hypothetical protein
MREKVRREFHGGDSDADGGGSIQKGAGRAQLQCGRLLCRSGA